jgi:putative phosphoribosyl transferase
MAEGSERVEFESANRMRLVGEIDWPRLRVPLPAVVFSHGWGSSKHSPRNTVIAARLAEAGIAAFRIDFTGHGESSGTPEDSTWAQQVADLKSALDYLAGRPEIGAVGVAGASTGGLVAIMFAAEDERVRALVLREPRTEGTDVLAARIKAPTLLIQGGAASPLQPAIRHLARLLRCAHRLEIIEGGGHLFEDPRTFQVVVEKTVEWFQNYLL